MREDTNDPKIAILDYTATGSGVGAFLVSLLLCLGYKGKTNEMGYLGSFYSA